MNTQTERPVRKPTNQRGKTARNVKHYNKQTAHVEARRDGKPLIFGWGKNLSHNDKIRIQRRATWGLAALIVLLLAGVIVGAWINLNIIIPGLAITSVNGHTITQGEYREMVAVDTQLELNKLYGPNGLTNQVTRLQKQAALLAETITQTQKTITDLQTQLKAKNLTSAQKTSLNTQLTAAQKTLTTQQAQQTTLQSQTDNLSNTTIPNEKELFTQSQYGNDSVTWLQDDELLRAWLATQSSAVQAKINPTDTQINKDFNSLKANMPTSNGYNTLLSSMGISDDQVRAMLTIIDRRNNAQTYLAAQLTSPSYQVDARQINVPTQKQAEQILQDLNKDQGKDFGTLAAKDSKDTNTNAKGGDLGWLTRYQYIDAGAGGAAGSSIIDNWIFDPSRKLNDISPVISANGAFYIVQITNIDLSRGVSSAVLSALKGNALVDWLQDKGGNGRPLPGQNITAPDQTKMFDTNNLPPNNILPSAAPSTGGSGGSSTLGS